jgi:hypothetical protein
VIIDEATEIEESERRYASTPLPYFDVDDIVDLIEE